MTLNGVPIVNNMFTFTLKPLSASAAATKFMVYPNSSLPAGPSMLSIDAADSLPKYMLIHQITAQVKTYASIFHGHSVPFFTVLDYHHSTRTRTAPHSKPLTPLNVLPLNAILGYQRCTELALLVGGVTELQLMSLTFLKTCLIIFLNQKNFLHTTYYSKLPIVSGAGPHWHSANQQLM